MSRPRLPRSAARALLALVAALLPLACAHRPADQTTEPAERFDVVIVGGSVLDGTGRVAVRADLGIRGDTIVRVSATPLPRERAGRVIDATGLVVAPGFVDLHAHLDPLLRLPDAESHVRQGVTTALGGPDGSAPWPLGTYLDSARALGVGMNVAFLAGHNTIRRAVLGTANRAPTADELARMRGMVATFL